MKKDKPEACPAKGGATVPPYGGIPFLLAGGDPKWRPSEPRLTPGFNKLSERFKETRGRPRKAKALTEPKESHEEE
jgi:hypothetical protein